MVLASYQDSLYLQQVAIPLGKTHNSYHVSIQVDVHAVQEECSFSQYMTLGDTVLE